ncbi:molybdate ABC transporter substrate-binding protein [Agromyces ramosus]|uniref:Molybdate transport system substrate-binding protein n=1 Tax=Agromyces ramosus TaxID=33879 RepID=A0ABU0RD82_9MICO|nr:molybdate ABC transporter substrate-binding protein [Agromyces ramosus]MDQ0895211.1 molybdate transport system substrate-binding protein [Agromyces ramosus]
MTARGRGIRFGMLASAAAAAFAALAGCSAESEAASDELRIFAAASLQGAFDELATRFEGLHPDVDIAPISYDGSSTLAAQLLAGAPADVFASADEPSMARVADDGLVEGEPEAFATNVMTIAVGPGNPLGIEGPADLAGPAAPAVVLCAPEVPCGAAAHSLLERAGVAVTPASEEQNVTAVLTKVRTGEADAGLVYVTDVEAAEGEVDAVEIEGADAVTNVYPIAALTGARDPAAARAFVEFVRSPAGAEVLDAFGFGRP